MNKREDFGCFIPLISTGVWIWFFTLTDNTLARFICIVMAAVSGGYFLKRFWHGAPTVRTYLRVADIETATASVVCIQSTTVSWRRKLLLYSS